MNVATVPPGAVAYAHVHIDFEVMLFILNGKVSTTENLEKSMDNEAGTYLHRCIPRGHQLSDSEPVIAVVARRTLTSGRIS